MATLTAWTFPNTTRADAVVLKLQQLESQGLIHLEDCAVISWPDGAKKPWTREMHTPAKGGALGGGVIGLLVGLIFVVPLLGAAIAAAAGGLSNEQEASLREAFSLDEKRMPQPEPSGSVAQHG